MVFFYTIIIFEFDQSKRQANLVKHGIDFIDAQQLWNDPNLLEISAKTIDEPRALLIGRINKKILVWCYDLSRRQY